MRASAQPRGLPTVSVVIPTYNRGQSLARCVESLLRSEGVCLEVILVDQNDDGFVWVKIRP